jgi:hypothetical protein
MRDIGVPVLLARTRRFGTGRSPALLARPDSP